MSRKQDTNEPTPTTTVPSTGTGSLSPSGYRATNPPPGSTETTVPTGGTGQNPLPGSAGGTNTWDQEAQDYYYTYGVPKGNEPTGFQGYNRYRDPIRFLGSLDDRERMKYVNIMYTRGWYGSKKPGDGLTDDDLTVFGDLLAWSNRRGMVWQDALTTLEAQPVRQASRPRVQVASTQDLTEVARRVALETIGRTMTDQELAKFIGSYQSAQRAEAWGSAEQAPQADVFFKNRIEKAYGKETDVYKHLVAISNVANLLEKL